MKEIKNIVKLYNEIVATASKVALATVVRAEGSSYRRTGARMLVLDNGTWSGGISGGCLEGDALKRARIAIANESSSIVTYDTTEEDKHQIGVGLGCQGIIDVLFTPLYPGDHNNPVEILNVCLQESRQTHILISILRTNDPLQKGLLGKMIRYRDKEDLKVFTDQPLQIKIEQAIRSQSATGKSAPIKFTVEDGSFIELFIELLPPEIHVVLWGHQYDVLPMVSLINELGWKSTIVANPLKVLPRLYKMVDAVITPENFDQIHIDEYTAVLLMSHDYKTDKYNLPLVLRTAAPFIGLLGPQKRALKIMEELLDEKAVQNQGVLEKVHAPVGLDIGAITPEEIALSIVAEIRAFFAGRDGRALKFRSGPIHDRI